MKSTNQLLIVHLTDAHIKNESSIGRLRLEKIALSIGALIESDMAVLVIFSGDIAFSGLASQYKVAAESIRKMKGSLIERGATSFHFMSAPGNHDCDFDAIPASVRDALLASPQFDQSILTALSATQVNYNNFVHSDTDQCASIVNDVLKVALIECGPIKLRLVALNTSVSSSLHEKPGSLKIPDGLLDRAIGDDADISLVLAHHPLNWFKPKDALLISEWLDQNADIVFLGHEHRVDDLVQMRKKYGSHVNYVIGLPLEDKTDSCGFRCIRVDLSTLDGVEFEGRYEKTSELCAVKEVGQWGMTKNSGRNQEVLHFSAQFSAFLNDPGAGFTHPRINRAVELDDIFVPAEFRAVASDKSAQEHVDLAVQQSDLASALFKEAGRTLIFGSEQSGKTAFAKRLILEARARKFTPIYLDVADLRSVNRGDIRGWFNSSIEKQYDADCRKRIMASSPDAVLLILDNAQMIAGGVDGIELALDFLSVKADRLLILTSENPAVSILSAQGQQEYKYWRSANVLELLPLGHRRRGELIRKWVAMGRTYIDASHEIESEVRQAKLLLDRALGKSALPKYPLFILALLQQIEGLKRNKTSVANGSHGYLFEALVSQAIDRHVRSHEIGAVTDFLAAIARLSWQRDGAPLSKSGIDGLLQAFRKKLVKIDGDALLSELERARIFQYDGFTYRFRYQYLYYYYLAKWTSSRADKAEGIEFVEHIVSLIHTELSANVLMFLAHFEEEQLVIDKVVPLMESLFSDQEPCRLERRSSLSSRYSTAEQRAVLLQGPPREVSDAHHERLDQHEVEQDSALQIEDSLKLNTTLKALHVLGQVLKSRATSIPEEEMIRVANASMLGARRFMNFAYEIIEENAEGIVHGVSEAFEKAFKLSKPKAVVVANAVMGLMVLSVARLGITRAAETMGAAELEPLVDHLEGCDPDEDVRLILLVAKIIGNKNYPKEQVEDYVRSLGASNVLPIGVLATAVARRFYLDPPDRSTREGACALLGIDQKKLPPKSRRSDIYDPRGS